MRVRVTTPPAPVVSLDDMRCWARIDTFDDDVMLDQMIRAATQSLDAPHSDLGISLGVQTLEMTFPACDWRCGMLRLWYPPVRDVVGVTYIDRDGAARALEADRWVHDGNAVRPAAGASWPDAADLEDVARVTYVAGHDVVPEPIRIAVIMLAAQWYLAREPAAEKPMSELPFAVSHLVAPYRILRM